MRAQGPGQIVNTASSYIGAQSVGDRRVVVMIGAKIDARTLTSTDLPIPRCRGKNSLAARLR